MTEIGEAIAMAPGAAVAAGPGSLTVTVQERSSEAPVPGVKVDLSGPSSGSATTDASGQARFSGLPPGKYTVKLQQDEFELTPADVGASVAPGKETELDLPIRRVMLTLVLKRIHLKGVMRAAVGDKGELEYGHWWIEINGAESYGWWPAGPVSIGGTFRGVPGALNGVPYFAGGTPTRDPHHGDTRGVEEMFHPRILSGNPPAVIKTCIRGFAGGYSGSWSWPWGQNCHSFQEAMMEHCGLSQSGGKKVP